VVDAATVTLRMSTGVGGTAIEAAVRSAMGHAPEYDIATIALPALETVIGGFPLEEAARIEVRTVRDELERSPAIETVIFALPGAATYRAFQLALGAGEPTAPPAHPIGDPA